jgi:outer membrane biosynthesis protein TonB
MVDVQAAPVPGAPPPAYPQRMRNAGIEAHLTVQFVVDTTGHAGPATVLNADVDGDASQSFLEAIQESLTHTRYHPATINGHPVRQLVQQQFVFLQLR